MVEGVGRGIPVADRSSPLQRRSPQFRPPLEVRREQDARENRVDLGRAHLLHAAKASSVDWRLTSHAAIEVGHIPKDAIGVVPAGPGKTWNWRGDHSGSILVLLDPGWLSALEPEVRWDPWGRHPVRLVADKLALTLVDALSEEVGRRGDHGGRFVRSASELLGIQVLRTLDASEAQRRPRRHGGLAGWQLRHVKAAIEANDEQTLSLDTLANMVGLSSAHFCKAFQQSMGTPPHRWQLEQKISRAQQMMADPKITLTEIAMACGFASSSHFAKVYRRVKGHSASEYRRIM